MTGDAEQDSSDGRGEDDFGDGNVDQDALDHSLLREYLERIITKQNEYVDLEKVSNFFYLVGKWIFPQFFEVEYCFNYFIRQAHECTCTLAR